MLWINDKVKDHFQHPRNYGPMTSPDAVGEIGNRICGDRVRLFLRLNDSKDSIDTCSFQVHGCPTAIAAASAMTEMIKGKTLDEANAIRDVDISEELGGFPEDKMHCCTMAEKVLKSALVDAGKITGDEARKVSEDVTYLSVAPGGTSEMMTGLVVKHEEMSQMDKLQIIMKVAQDLGVLLIDVNQKEPSRIKVKLSIATPQSQKDAFISKVKMTLNDDVVLI